MLPERKASSVHYDAHAKTARLEVTAGGGASREVAATLLLDAKGGVVGVDVEPDAASRVIVMAGRHEDVHETKSVRVAVSRDAGGDVTSVVVRGVTSR
jgi:hypothetical protein